MPSEGAHENKSYRFLDVKPLKGINYYRLKIVDMDNAFSFSPVKSIILDSEEDDFVLYPNPNKGEFLIRLAERIRGEEIQVVVFNPLGENIYDSIFDLEDNQNELKIDTAFKTGIYFCKIKTFNTEKVFKIIVE